MRTAITTPSSATYQGGGDHQQHSLREDWSAFDVGFEKVTLPALDAMLISGSAQAYVSGTMTRQKAESDVEKHHDARARAVLAPTTEKYMGTRQAAQTRLATVKKDIPKVEAELARQDKYVEVQVPRNEPLTTPEKAQLWMLVVGAVLLAIFSIYSTMSFFNGAGLLSGANAMGMSIGPIAFSIVIKIALEMVGTDSPKRFIVWGAGGIVAVSAIAWIATMACEASSGMADTSAMLNLDPAAASPQSGSGSWWLLIRAVAQMCIELAGAALIVDRFFDIWKRSGCIGGWTKVVEINPKYAALDADRLQLQHQETALELFLGRLEAWAKAHEAIVFEYVSRAQALLVLNINFLGASHA